MAFPHARALAAVLPVAAIGLWAGSATAAPVGAIQLTNFTNDSSQNGLRQELAVNAANGKAMTIVAAGTGNSGGKETFALPLASDGAIGGSEAMLLTGAAVNKYTQPSVGFNPDTGEALTCFGDLTATEIACQLLNADGTTKGSSFPVSSGWSSTDYQQSSVVWSPVLKQYMVLVSYPDNLYTLPISATGVAGTSTPLPFSGVIEGGTDLAYSTTSNTFMAVFRANEAAEPLGVWAWGLDGEGKPVGPAQRLASDGTAGTSSGSITWNAGANKFMVVATSGDNLVVQSFAGVDGAATGALQTFDMPDTVDNRERYRPLIASHSSADQALIVFSATDNADAKLATYGLQATSTSLASSLVRIDGNATEETGQRPRVQFNASTCKYLLTYQKNTVASGWQLFSNQYTQDLPCPKPEPAPVPTPSVSPTVIPVVTQVGSVRRKALSGGRTQVIVNLRYNATGRYSLLLEGPTGKRIPLLRGSRMGRMPAMFMCPSIVQGGVAGTGVTFKGIIRGRVPEGAVLRAIRRGADGALTGADVHIS